MRLLRGREWAPAGKGDERALRVYQRTFPVDPAGGILVIA
jgi:hypothetical protein